MHLHKQSVRELAQSLGPELLPLVCVFRDHSVLQVSQKAAGACASQRALQQQHALLAEQLFACPRPLFLVISAAAEGAGLHAAEALEGPYASLVKHVAAAEDDLQCISKRKLKLQNSGQDALKADTPRPTKAEVSQRKEAYTWSSCLNCSLQMGHGSALSLRPQAFCSAAAHSSSVSSGGGASTNPSLDKMLVVKYRGDSPSHTAAQASAPREGRPPLSPSLNAQLQAGNASHGRTRRREEQAGGSF